MAIQIQVGSTSSANNVLNKAISLGSTISVTLKQPASVEAPVFIVNSGLVSHSNNYLYCPDFNRYYFITDIVPQTGGAEAIICSVDPLMSFNEQIKALTVNVSREESAEFSDIGDSNVVTLARDSVIVRNFSGSLPRAEKPCYVLAVAN